MAYHIADDLEAEKIFASPEKSLFYFHAPWCVSCKKFAPILKEIMEESKGVKLYKISVDDFEEFAQSKGVVSLPHITLVQSGSVFAHLKSYDVNRSKLSSEISRFLSIKPIAVAAPVGGEADAIKVENVNEEPKAPVRMIEVPDLSKTAVDCFRVSDYKTNSCLNFEIVDGKIYYTVDGVERPPFRDVRSDGANRLLFPEINKGVSLPWMNLHIHLGCMLALVKKVGGTSTNFPSSVPLANDKPEY